MVARLGFGNGIWLTVIGIKVREVSGIGKVQCADLLGKTRCRGLTGKNMVHPTGTYQQSDYKGTSYSNNENENDI